MKEDTITIFKFQNEIDEVKSEFFFEISKEKSTRGHTKKVNKKQVRKDIRYFCRDIMVDEWNNLSYENECKKYAEI